MPTPTEVFHRLLEGITARTWTQLAPLYAPDAHVQTPFALPEPVTLHGRDEIAAHFRASSAAPLQLTARNVVVHETADPEVIVAEFDYDAQITTTGEEFTVANVQVLRIHDGLIAETRDYHDHARLAAALTA
jgi:ketosteroid isomerase-like protein